MYHQLTNKFGSLVPSTSQAIVDFLNQNGESSENEIIKALQKKGEYRLAVSSALWRRRKDGTIKVIRKLNPKTKRQALMYSIMLNANQQAMFDYFVETFEESSLDMTKKEVAEVLDKLKSAIKCKK